MFTLVSRGLSRIPVPYRWWVELGLVLLLLGGGLWLANHIQSCSYHKAQQENQEKDKKLQAQQDDLRKSAEQKETKVKELEIQVAVTKQVAEQGKKVDDQISQKIEQVAKEAINDEVQADNPSNCHDRVVRVCNGLRAVQPPIAVDCDALERKQCGTP